MKCIRNFATFSQVEIANDLEQPWSTWENNVGVDRAHIEGTTFFYTTLTDLTNYITRESYWEKQWVQDNTENWLIVITDGIKFDDAPWPIPTELQLELPKINDFFLKAFKIKSALTISFVTIMTAKSGQRNK